MMYSENLPILSIHELVTMRHKIIESEQRHEQAKIKAKEIADAKAYQESQNFINKYLTEEAISGANRANFLNNVKTGLVSSALYKICKESFTEKLSKHDEQILSKFFTEFVTEQGAGKLLLDWKYKNVILAEVANVCNETYNSIRDSFSTYRNYYMENESSDGRNEQTPDNKPDILKLDKDQIDDFYNKISSVDTDQASTLINSRVGDAINDFIDSNAENKAECEEIIADAENRIQKAKTPEAAEAIQAEATRQIQIHNQYKRKNPFHCIVEAIIKASLTDENLKSLNINESNVDMDNIVHSAKLVYSFLETLSTLQVVDEQFVIDYITSSLD